MPLQAPAKRRQRSARWPKILLILSGFLLILVGKADLAAVRTAQSGIIAFVMPVYDTVAMPVRALENLLVGLRGVAALREEAVLLRLENERLKRWQRRSEILESENRQLRAVLGVALPPEKQAVTARVIAAPGGSFFHSLLVDHGAGYPVRRGDPVVTADGLVGMVIAPGTRYSRVLLITDVNARIPILLSRENWPGLSVGRNGQLLKLDFLPLNAAIETGELVQTSGHGGLLPAGLPVGRVVRVEEESVLVEPAVDLVRLSYVSILLGNPDELRTNIAEMDNFFMPLPEAGETRLLEGFSPRDVLQ